MLSHARRTEACLPFDSEIGAWPRSRREQSCRQQSNVMPSLYVGDPPVARRVSYSQGYRPTGRHQPSTLPCRRADRPGTEPASDEAGHQPSTPPVSTAVTASPRAVAEDAIGGESPAASRACRVSSTLRTAGRRPAAPTRSRGKGSAPTECCHSGCSFRSRTGARSRVRASSTSSWRREIVPNREERP
jgi:hypothetical protein